ncbi:MAG TPA: multidrug effflux MFS transporter [Trebonia sp.]|jgi:DHA1 family bicyclomycin/chloramphenicol resistance-like MFS transporter|nr:multidrug effflux MFS transporter [Trebonia sp.]
METFEGSPAPEAGESGGAMTGPAVPPAGPGRRLGMLAVLGALSAFGPLSMDMYLPSTPTIAASLHAGQPLVQLTLSGCLAGLAVGQLVAGPVSDGMGRRRPLLAGLAAFTVLSIACAAAPDIGALIAFRFLQGMAGAVGVVLSLAIVRDLYEGTELARVLGSLTLVFGLAPVLAPVAGGQVLRFTSWRGVFGVLAAIGLVLLAAGWFLPETLLPDRRTPPRFRQLRDDSRTLLRDRRYTGNALAVALGTAALITYISALPFIVEDAYHQSPQLFSLFFTINAIGLTSMAQLGARLVRRLPVARVVRASLLAMAAGALAFLAGALTGHPPLAALLVPLFVFVASFGMMRPNGTALALAGQGSIAGTASAWLGALPFMLGAAASPLAGLGGQGGATAAGLLLSVLCAGALCGQALLTRGSAQA